MGNVTTLVLDEAAIARQVEVERIRVFNQRSTTAAGIAFVGIGLMVWVLVAVAGWSRALAWALGISAVEAAILLAGYACTRALQRQRGRKFWLCVQMVLAGISGIAWGSAVWFVWMPGQFVAYLATLTILVGVAGVSIVTMSSYAVVGVSFFGAIYFLPVLHELMFPKEASEVLVFGLLVIMALQIWYARGLGVMLRGEIEHFVRNQALVERLNDLVIHDQLTGALSRRYMFERLEQQVALQERHGTQATLVMFDLDHFKAINDRYGHPAGDRALCTVVNAVKAQLREGDLLGRIGGEEFLVLLPMTDMQAAHAFAERLRQTLESTSLTEGNEEIHLPASFGVAQLRPGEGFAEWLRRADGALYQAKNQGRNSVSDAA